jgi:hypothetical protein
MEEINMKSLANLKLKQKQKKVLRSYTLNPETVKKIEKLANINNLKYVDIIEFSIDFLYENLKKDVSA